MDPLDWFGQLNNADFKTIGEKLAAERAKAERTKELDRDLAIQVAKILESDDWKPIAAKIEALKVLFVRTPEEYHHDASLASIDYGARVALTLLTNWLEHQNKIVDHYAKSNRGQNEKTGQ